ncbi:ABC transporter substrate-binding protein [Colwelliaceae bacterium 6441]
MKSILFFCTLFLSINVNAINDNSLNDSSKNENAINVTFINPSIPGTAFWDRVTAIAKAAAQDLNINLTVVYGRDNRIFNLEAIQAVSSKSNKPDYLVFMPYDGNSELTFSTINNAKIPFITLERTLLEEEHEFIKLPQQKYNYWLGEIFHDNIIAGELLADSLIASIRHDRPHELLTIAGISGSFSGESNQRNLGLEKSVAKHKNVKLLQIVPAIWSRERSREIIHQLYRRFGHIDIAWTASDGMALGVLDYLQSGYNNLNHQMKVGGIDWTVEAIEMVNSNKLTATVGGHIFQTAWALIKIFDHHQNKNVFKKGADSKTYDLQLIDRNNIDQYYVLGQKVDWHRVDFKAFTLSATNQVNYDFDVKLLLKYLKEE